MIGGQEVYSRVCFKIYIPSQEAHLEQNLKALLIVSKLEETASIVYYNTEQNLQYNLA